MNCKTLALASLFMLAGTIAVAEPITREVITGDIIQDVNQDANGRYFAYKQGPFYQYEDPNNPGFFYAKEWWNMEPVEDGCNECSACPSCR